jgi:hypothetical protein
MPVFMALLIAMVMDLRNDPRIFSCRAMFFATSVACVSGRMTSLMLSLIFFPTSFWSWLPSFSMFEPFAPMSTPGRAVWMITVIR